MKVKILDIAKRLIEWDKKLEIYKNGEDNAYPERVDRLINNSVTAKMSLDILTQYLIGKGFGDVDNFIINKDNKEKLIYFAEKLADSLSEFRGVAIHYSYNALFEPCNPVILPFENIRLGKKDSKKYNGKILVSDDWTKAKQDDIQMYDVFNPDAKIVEKQVARDGGITKYKGQILFINEDYNYYYPLSRIDSVMNDCDSEAQASQYKNQLLRKGFFGKTLIITKPLVDSSIPEYLIDADGKQIPNREYMELESEAEQVKKTLEDFIGAENAGGAMLMEMDWAGDKMDEAIKIQNIEGKIDDKMFEYTENSVSKNILMSFCNLPVALVKSPDAALLGNSGESMKEAKRLYWENTMKERNRFETILNDVLQYCNTGLPYLTVKNLLDANNTLDNTGADSAI
jgi:hypothetical protein